MAAILHRRRWRIGLASLPSTWPRAWRASAGCVVSWRSPLVTILARDTVLKYHRLHKRVQTLVGIAPATYVRRAQDRLLASDGGEMTQAVLGIIGGSGIYDLPGLQNVREQRIASPWGEPSGALRIGEIAGLPVVFLPRHDKGHRLSPSDINYRANIDVLKRAGVTDLVSLSACGSFKEDMPPGTFVLIDQFVDRTYKRESSFFGKGLVAHVSMAHPVSPRLRVHLGQAAEAEG